MKFASLGSGSSGNATVVSAGDEVVLVDCGFGIKDTEKRLSRIGLTAAEVTAIVVTHEHTDHIKGVSMLARKYGMPVYMTRGTFLARDYGRIPDLRYVESYRTFQLGELRINPVAVPHDAREPAQYVFEHQGRSLGVLTDLGSVTPHVVQSYESCDALLVEANHDLNMLSTGPYPRSLQNRVSSDWGHLNNRQTADFLSQLALHELSHLVVGHISRKNNALSCVVDALTPVLPEALQERVLYACQDDGFDWLVV